jgi:LmbE family N-acetylglucosaminyl deacetylase
MSIHAHPDDQEFTIAGTLAKWARAGCEIVCVVITSGDSGSNDPAHDAAYKPVLARLREAEQLAANEVLGVKETIFLRYPDGELEHTIALRRELTRLIRLHKPEVVLTGSPDVWFYESYYINHPDHQAASQAATAAVFPSAGSRLMFADLLDGGYEPHNVKRLYIHGAEKPDTWIDIAETIGTKVEALRKHASQIGDRDMDAWMREWAAETGKEKGLEYAEAHRVMVLVEEEETAEAEAPAEEIGAEDSPAE